MSLISPHQVDDQVDDPVKLKSPSISSAQVGPCTHSVVSGRDIDWLR